MPQGYGLPVGGDATWGLNYMIHNLNSSDGRQVYITWEIDWVPQTAPARTDINRAHIQWLDVAGAPHIYPVFDAKRSYDPNGDGQFVFPDEVSTDPSQPELRRGGQHLDGALVDAASSPETLVFGAGHLHPGGLHVDLQVARDGPDAGTRRRRRPVRDQAAVPLRRPLLRARGRGQLGREHGRDQRRDWRISLKKGDTVSINVTYDVRKASWYESMGILPLAVSNAYDPAAKDPFDDEAAVKAMYDEGGILTHGRLPENIDSKANTNLHLPDPRDLKAEAKKRVQVGRVAIDGFLYSQGGYSAITRFPAKLMRPPTVQAGPERHLHQPGRALRRARRGPGLALDHLLQGAL